MTEDDRIGIIGLGYVGFPLACLLATKYAVTGYDINPLRVEEINRGEDNTLEVEPGKIAEALRRGMVCTCDKEALRGCNVYIVTVPTPIDRHNVPDLAPLESASRLIGSLLSQGDIVVYESTVYPGLTEGFCAPILEAVSGMKVNEGFFIGYSPERVNPGDKKHPVEQIIKITSGSTPETAAHIDRIYHSVLQNGTYRAPSIKVAEAAKVVENAQRDVNIAFMNEIARIMDVLGVDTDDVLQAAGSKWNFLPFRPGLVGGHCIGVDPYYLIEEARLHGVTPALLMETRRINAAMGSYVAERVICLMNKHGLTAKDAQILILGFSFKENCPDIRNTRIVDIVATLREYTSHITVYDPWVDPAEVRAEYGVDVCTRQEDITGHRYDAIILGVAHDCFRSLPLAGMTRPGGVVYDVKGILDRKLVTKRL